MHAALLGIASILHLKARILKSFGLVNYDHNTFPPSPIRVKAAWKKYCVLHVYSLRSSDDRDLYPSMVRTQQLHEASRG